MDESSGEFTSEMGLMVHDIIKERQTDVDRLTHGDLSLRLLLRELMNHSFIQGYFSGLARKPEDS